MHIAIFLDQHPRSLGGIQTSVMLQKKYLDAGRDHQVAKVIRRLDEDRKPYDVTMALIEEMLISVDVLDRDVTLRMNGDKPLLTDEANYIVDLHLKRIGNPRQLSMILNQIPGVVENGLFIDICDIVIIGHGDGRVQVRDINAGTQSDDRIHFAPTDNIFTDLGD